MTPIFSIILFVTLGIAVFLIAQLLYNLHRQKMAEKLLASFEQAAREFDVRISKKQVTDHWIIGFDADANKILFMQQTTTGHDGYLIDLADIASATIVKQHRPFWHRNMKSGVLVETIALQFDYKDDTPSLQLPFYKMSIDPVYYLSDREQQVKEWHGLVMAKLEKEVIETRKQGKPVEKPLVLIDQVVEAGMEA